MIIPFQFTQNHSLEKRITEARRIRAKFPDKIPVIAEPRPGSTFTLDKTKYLVPNDLSVGQFIYILRKRIHLKPEEALFLFVNNKIPSTAELVSKLYEEEKDESGFLMFHIAGESTFGSTT